MNSSSCSEITPLLRREMKTSSRCDVKDVLRRRIPIIAWLPNYSINKFLQDCLAGFTVGLTVIPQGIAYAIVAGLPAQYGLYSSFMGCFVYLFFGSSKDITVGPTAIMALLSLPYVKTMGPDVAVLLCFLTGCLITLMGVFHLGFLVDFISMPVICGFTNAAALIIGCSQVGTLFGLSGRSESVYDAVMKLVNNFSEIKLWDTTLGILCIMALFGLKNLPGKKFGSSFEKVLWLLSLSRNAIVVITGTIIAYSFSLNNSIPFKITGNITEGLPPFSPPPFSTIFNNKTYTFLDMTTTLGSSIASVPFIAILESIAIGKAFAKGRSLDATQEMIALGLCNIMGSFVKSMPVTGSFTRTAVNYASGVKTPMGGIVTGSIVLLACGLLTSAFKFIPKATLAAVIIFAMYNMLEFHIFSVLWKTKKVDIIPLTVTLVCSLIFGPEYGMLAGITINLMLLLYFTARPGLIIEERTVDGLIILFVSPKQSLSFPAAEYLREQVMSWCDGRRETIPVILDGRNVTRIDTTVAKNLTLLHMDLEMRKQKLILWKWCDEAKKTLTCYDSETANLFRSGTLSQIFSEENNFVPDRVDVII
ncbi:sodium-independent sulfate anion transporter-like isoform X1 [Leptopilina heterotoma]|uniref:sodium-independent sulfate anion transporter-like isoform X1 n=2 Tax=Leptopilina heterotoma TaxID=63436 RepID=UPI001CA97981|nr:sodium-independent sulfate anion transporter-like isoform X1 [Leptopilina heterotoma]